MRIGYTDLESRNFRPSLANMQAAERDGLDTFWVAGGWRDSVTLCALGGRETSRIDVGSGILSVWQITPIALAEQALTIHDAVDGRFVLGLGLSHFHMVEQRLGMKFEKPIRYLREYLSILMAGMEQRQVDFTGELLSAHTDVRVQAEGRPKVLIAALGPQAVRVAGAHSDGTVTFMVPLQSLVEMTMPECTKAAEEAGRPRPYFCANVPMLVTNDVERARDDAAQAFANYGNGYYPSYRNALDRGGVQGPREMAIVGDEESVARQIDAYRAEGIDELVCVPFGPKEEQLRTRAFLGSLSQHAVNPSKAAARQGADA